MIALDAGVLIAALDTSDTHHEPARRIFLAHSRSFMHPVNLGEALVQAVHRDRERWARDQLTDLGVQQVALDDEHAFQLARARDATRLRMPDVCALVTAETRDIPLATFDDRLAAAARSRGVTVRP